MVLIDVEVYFEYIQVIRCNIEAESVEKSRDVENGPISEKNKGYTLKPICKTPRYFF
jgi:hypothetical protein